MFDRPITERTLDRLVRDQAERLGGRPYLLFEDREYSFADIERLSRRIANGLVGLGVAKGSHVAMLFNNCPEQLLIYLAIVRLGAVAVPVNAAARGDLMVYFLTQSDATLLLAEPSLAERWVAVQDRTPDIRALVLFDEFGTAGDLAARAAVPVHDFADLLAASDAPLPEGAARFNDLSHISYTSGTTGPSKGNMATHAHTIAQGINTARAYGYRDDDVLFTCLPLLHGNALLACVVPALVSGAAIALSRRFSASNFWKEIHALGATQFNLLGAMANILWSQPPSLLDRWHKVRQSMVVPVPGEFLDAFEARYGLTVTSLYALSDFGMGTFRGPDTPAAKKASAGLPGPGVALRIVDDEDLPLPPGTVGEVVLRPLEPWFAPLGYWDMPEATCRTWQNLWFHTGDRGWVDEDGWFYFADRKKDSIRRRGQNISSFEVEQVILRHPAVADVAVHAVKSEMSEDEVMASVSLREGAAVTEADLVAFCAENMSYFMVPRYIEFRQEMPRTASEKVQKYKLREEAEARLGELWDREKAGIKLAR